MNKQGKNLLIALLVGAGFALAVILLNWNSGKETVRIFCDAFTLAAVMLLGFAGLVWSRNEGTFDMLNYGVSRSFKYRYKKRDEKYKESFYALFNCRGRARPVRHHRPQSTALGIQRGLLL